MIPLESYHHDTILHAGSGDDVDYISMVDQQLTFTDAQRVQELTILIIPDNFTELNETFSAMLSSVFLSTEAGGSAIDLSDEERARLIRNPDTAVFTILDDDGRYMLLLFGVGV